MLKNCFENINCFPWIKLIPALIHLKYWYYNSSWLELPCLPHHLCQILPLPTETLCNIILIMFFTNIPILFYTTRPQVITSLWYTEPYVKASYSNLSVGYIQTITVYGSNKLSIKKPLQHDHHHLYLQYKVYWISYKMVGTTSIFHCYLCI